MLLNGHVKIQISNINVKFKKMMSHEEYMMFLSLKALPLFKLLSLLVTEGCSAYAINHYLAACGQI